MWTVIQSILLVYNCYRVCSGTGVSGDQFGVKLDLVQHQFCFKKFQDVDRSEWIEYEGKKCVCERAIGSHRSKK